MIFSPFFCSPGFLQEQHCEHQPQSLVTLVLPAPDPSMRLEVALCCSPGQDEAPGRATLSLPGSQLGRAQTPLHAPALMLPCSPRPRQSQGKQKSPDKPRDPLCSPTVQAILVWVLLQQVTRHLPGSSATQQRLRCAPDHLNNLLSMAKWLTQKAGCFTGAGEFLCLQFQYLAVELCLVYGYKVALFLF